MYGLSACCERGWRLAAGGWRTIWNGLHVGESSVGYGKVWDSVDKLMVVLFQCECVVVCRLRFSWETICS